MGDNLKITIPDPSFGSSLTQLLFDLEKLRHKKLGGSVPPYIFFQLKEIFHILETLGSSRLEGNHTTLAEYVEKVIENNVEIDEQQQEVENIEKAICFVEENTDEDTVFVQSYFSEIHKMIVKGLTPPASNGGGGEGSNNPGNLRTVNVAISGSDHVPPDFLLVPDYFNEFMQFISSELVVQKQLLMLALSHHRFAYIHPFDNGNGRLGRVLNYALLIKLGFNVKNGRIINPSSVFFSDREKYNQMLSQADSLKDDDLLAWCEYFLAGLKNETEKIDSLLEHGFVKNNILKPAINFSRERETITADEKDVLLFALNKPTMSFKSRELSELGIINTKAKTRVVENLRKKNMLRPIANGKREYTVNFVNSYILRGIIKQLEKHGFVDDFLRAN